MMRLPMIVLATSLAASDAASQDAQEVFNNMAAETIQCAAYYTITSVALEASDKHDLAQQYEKVSAQALGHAGIVTKEAGLKEETVGARYKIAVDEMMSRIGQDTSNISILMADYDKLCIEVMNDPEKRGRYWSDKLATPHQ
jgi:hypothetical protein